MSWIKRIFGIRGAERLVQQLTEEPCPPEDFLEPEIPIEVIKEIPQKKYWYPCEETNNEDGTTTLQAVFVDCAGTAIVGRKETSRVCQKVVDFAVALSEERGLPLIFWTGGNPYEYEQIFKKDGYGHFQVFDKPESYNRQQGKPKDFVTIMIDDIIKEYIAKRCEVIPSEYHCAYDICPEHFREIS